MVSVCMAVYNGEKYIKQQINSILEQLDEYDELIISDDSSTDSTLAIIKSYNDKRIKLLSHKKEQPIYKYGTNIELATKNFENTLNHVNGDYIFLSDQDDIWLKNRKQVCLKYLENNDIILCNYNIIDANGDILENKVHIKNPISRYIVPNLINQEFIGCCMAFNKKILGDILPFPKNLYVYDVYIGCIGMKTGKFHFIDEVLHSYRRHGNNISCCKKSNNPFLFKISYRIKLYLQIMSKLLLSK